MLLSRLFLFTVAVATSYAAPVFSTPKMVENGLMLTEALSDFYENIIDQVMLDVSEDVLRYLPETISADAEGRHSVIQSIDRNLNFMRASLLASVGPLVSTDIPQIAGLNTLQLTTLEEDMAVAIPQLNQKISRQLGLILNAKQSSRILIRQASSLTKTITVEWKLRQPFQLNIVRQTKEEENNAQADWLYEKLSHVQVDLLNEFNDRTQEAIQLVVELLEL
ncbi:hypothetical protein BY458DRAFT_524267 [Sporodiniella umbellata]|nr:hypothetical protein BY458DRAFT_524267 [Sporodiniella umbellata]